jgi:hypothetical protein
MSELYSQKAGLFERLLKLTDAQELADIAIDTSKLEADAVAAERALMFALPGMAVVLVDPERTDSSGRIRYLRITGEQRETLASRLRSIAGEDPENETLDNDRSPATMGIVILWRWFQESWLGSDAR